METSTPAQVPQNGQLTTKGLFSTDKARKKFEELLGKRAPGFITSVLQAVTSNDKLKNADPNTVLQAAAMAATLDLPINNNLGFAYIVPYSTTKEVEGRKIRVSVAQFQMGYKGFIQLAQRSGQFKTISASPIYKGQLISEDPLKGFEFDFTKKESDEVIGYAAYFQLLNGFEKTLYMTREELEKHGKKFSQTFKQGFGLWKDEFDSMAVKTVLKLLLAKFAPLSIEMQRAVVTDQAIINDAETEDVTYIDASSEPVELTPEEKEAERVRLMLEDCKTVQDVIELQEKNPDWDVQLFEDRKEQIKQAVNSSRTKK